jgi:hypothetical protein
MNRAISAVCRAVLFGRLPKITEKTKCVDCGAVARVYDHRDYNRPIHVVPVCSRCNKLRGHAKPINRRTLMTMRLRAITVFAAFMILMSPALADELVLKDGKRVPWKTLSDDGEAYAVETVEGKRLTVRKADVDRISIGRPEVPASTPLTGASFAFDVKRAVTTDILPRADVKGSDSWKTSGRILVGAATWPTRQVVTFDTDVPEEYDLTLVVERADSGNKDFAVGILAAGAQCAFHFDSWDGTASSLALVAGAESEKAPGGVFRSGKPRTVRLMVRRDGLVVQLDGKDFWKGRPDWKQATPHSAVVVREKSRLFLVAAGGAWKVSAFTLTQVK